MAMESAIKIIADIDLSAGNKVLTEAESHAKFLIVKTGHASHVIIAPCKAGLTFIISNQDTVNNAIIKVEGLTGVTVDPGTNADVICNGTDYVTVAGINEVLYV